MRLLFLFLPAVLSFSYPHAPGMYPPEETKSSSVTVPPSPYGGDEEGPYLFYYEKDPAPPASKSAQAPGSAKKDGGRQSKVTESQEYDGPLPPPKSDGSWAKYINNPTTTRTETDSEDPYGSTGHGTHRPSHGPSTGSPSGPVVPIDPYEHESGHGQGAGKSTGHGSGSESKQGYESGSGTEHGLGHQTHLPGSHPDGDVSTDSLPPIDPYGNGKNSEHKTPMYMSIKAREEITGYESGSGSEHGLGHQTHLPGSHPDEDVSTDSLPPIDPYGDGKNSGHKTPMYMSIKAREEITGGKGYRDDRSDKFKEEEQLTLSPGPITRSDDLSEVQREVNKLPVLEETEESFKSSTRKSCCACCKENKPVLGGGYIEAASSAQVAPGPSAPQLLSPTPIGQAPPMPASLPSQQNLIGYSQNPLVQSYYTPVQATPVGGYSGGGGCGCSPQVCCQPVQPCCMPSLPCCPPPPPLPCCPQISICCQPIVPCCLPQITLPQICLPTIPLCFRGCPACPCRRRRSIDDPRHHSRVKRQSCMRRRVKRQSGCRQCSNWNAITQVAGGAGCGTCNGSHRRVKRMGCLPCGRKKREALEEEAHIRRKRSCLPCLNGRKKREAPGTCRKCSLLQTVVTRHKRSFNCGPCGGRKKRDASCSCARQKRAVNDFDTFEQCDRSCCDYSKCSALRARKLDLKN